MKVRCPQFKYNIKRFFTRKHTPNRKTKAYLQQYYERCVNNNLSFDQRKFLWFPTILPFRNGAMYCRWLEFATINYKTKRVTITPFDFVWPNETLFEPVTDNSQLERPPYDKGDIGVVYRNVPQYWVVDNG